MPVHHHRPLLLTVCVRSPAVAPEPLAATPVNVVVHRHWATRLLEWVWGYTHTEFSGFYSLEKLHSFQSSPETRVYSQLRVLSLATLPTIIVVMIIELIPLQDPSLPWTQNPGFYVRQLVRTWIMAIGGNIQLQEIIPQLRQPWPRLVFLSLAQIVTYVLTMMFIPLIFNIFPVPLSAMTPLVPSLVSAIAIRYLFMQKILDRNPELKPSHDRLEKMTGFVFSVILLYCIYGFVFRRVDDFVQIVLSAVLFAIKQWAKHRIWKLSHVHDHHDLSAESVSCGIHLFHALFTTTCLQSARSAGTFVIFMVLNLMQDILAFRFLRRASLQVDALTRHYVDDKTPWKRQTTLCLLQRKQRLQSDSQHAASESHTPILALRSAYVRYLAPLVDTDEAHATFPVTSSSTTNHQLEKATQAVANLLHCRELVLLRLFVDVFVPLFYLGYCVVMRYLPNGGHWRYFDNLAGLNPQTLTRLASSILPIVVIKLFVMYELCLLFRVHAQLSGMHQLTFVIKAQRWTMQTLFVLNFLNVIDFPLIHMGNDLSFRFAWLRKK